MNHRSRVLALTQETRKSTSRLVLQSSFLFMMASVGFMVPGLVRTKMAGVTLGEHGIALFGQLSQTQTLLITIGAAGLTTATRVILASGRLSTEQTPRAQSWLLWTPTAVATGLAILIAAFSQPISLALLGTSSYFLEVCAAAMGIPFAVMAQIALATAQARGEAKRLLLAAGAAAFGGGAAVVLLLLPGSQTLGSLSLVVAPAIQLLLILSFCRVTREGLLRYPSLSQRLVREVLTLGGASAALGGMAALAELAGRTVVLHTHGLETLAAYQPVALLVTQVIGLALSALATSSLLEVSRFLGSPALGTKLEELVIRIVPLATVAFLILIAMSPYLVELFFVSSLVEEAVPLLAIALIGEPWRAFAWLVGSCLLPLGLKKEWFALGIVTVLVQLGIVLTTVSTLGVASLSLGLTIGNAIQMLLSVLIVRRAGIDFRWRLLVHAMGLGLAVGVVPILGVHLGLDIFIPVLLLCLIILVVPPVIRRSKRRRAALS